MIVRYWVLALNIEPERRMKGAALLLLVWPGLQLVGLAAESFRANNIVGSAAYLALLIILCVACAGLWKMTRFGWWLGTVFTSLACVLAGFELAGSGMGFEEPTWLAAFITVTLGAPFIALALLLCKPSMRSNPSSSLDFVLDGVRRDPWTSPDSSDRATDTSRPSDVR
jgi:hypothetical protein